MILPSLRRRTAALGLALLAAGGSAAACSGGDDDAVSIALRDPALEQWQVFVEEAEAAGIDVELVAMSGDNAPNEAVKEGEVDVNQFQHLKYLARYNEGTDVRLRVVGSTEIVPLSLYWKDHDSIDGIEGEDVAIPNDPTNQGRAINLLAQEGLVELRGEEQLEPVPADIDEEASAVTVTPVDVTNGTVAYNEGRPAIMTNNFIARAGISPSEAVAQDDPEDPRAEPYINAFIALEDRTDDPVLLELVEIWHSEPVQEAIQRESRGTSVPVRRPAEELDEILERLEQDVRESR